MSQAPAPSSYDVLLATCARLPDGEPGGHLLLEAFAELGRRAAWARWDDPDVRWSDAGLVAVRSPWDYEARLPEFLGWARSVPRLLHGAEVFAWNLDKSYLLALAGAGCPMVPTTVVESEEELPPAIAAWPKAVVKPAVGAGGRGVVVFDNQPGGPAGLDESRLSGGPWIVQPLMESVRTEGEHSVFVLGGHAVSQVLKRPVGGEIRVHEEYGGSTVPADLDPHAVRIAEHTVRTAGQALGTDLVYARVDLLRDTASGELLVGELEVTEPGLYLDVLPDNATAFARAVVDLLGAEVSTMSPG